jgi:hypothetical protein
MRVALIEEQHRKSVAEWSRTRESAWHVLVAKPLGDE